MNKDEFAAWADTPEGNEILAPHIDRAINRAVRAHDEKLKPEYDRLRKEAAEAKEAAAKPIDIAKRLDRIETAAREKVRRAELGYHLRAKCAETGVDPSLLDGIAFTDEGEINARIVKLADRDADLRRAAINAQLSSGPKPGSGNPAPPSLFGGMLTEEEETVALTMRKQRY